jgi:uncharacterized protein
MTTGASVASDQTAALPPVWPGLCGTDDAGPFLVGGRCAKCSYTTLEVRPICPSCWAQGSMHPTPIGRRGRLYTYTVIHQLPAGYAESFAVGYVDLAEGIRVFAHIENTPEALRIGRELELTIAPLKRDDKGTNLHGPRYAEPRAAE